MPADVLRVRDHGVWRGHREWTITLRDARGTAQVSARDVETADAAIAQARETFAARREFTPAERAALRRSSDALRKWSR
jgi:acyl-CoA reductase-like NAD-dependent aldehyde dehydrogenase